MLSINWIFHYQILQLVKGIMKYEINLRKTPGFDLVTGHALQNLQQTYSRLLRKFLILH